MLSGLTILPVAEATLAVSDGRGDRSKNTADQFGVQTDLAGSLKIEQVRRGRRGAAVAGVAFDIVGDISARRRDAGR